MSLKKQVFSGILWSVGARILQQFAQFALSIILARLLLPKDFGLIGMITIFTGFVSVFSDGGVNVALIQREVLAEWHIYSVFWLNTAIGFFLFALLWVVAPGIAHFYGQPLLTPLTRVLAFIFIINGLGMVPSSLMQRRMEFDKVSKVILASTFISGLIGISLAYFRYGVWSLAVQQISFAVTSTCLNWAFGAWKPSVKFHIHAIKDLWNFAINLTGFNFINYWARNADNLVIGKLFGSSELGLYSRAYFFMTLPINQIIGVVSQVMVPALSSIQNDPRRIKAIYLRAIGVISLFTFPLMVGILVSAKPLILALYGERWAGVIPLLRILALLGMAQSLSNPTGWIYTSRGRTDLQFRWGVGYAMCLIAAILFGAYLGSTKTVAISYAVVNVALLYPWLYVSGKLIDLSVSEVVKAVLGPLIGATIMGIGLWASLTLFVSAWAYWQQLLFLMLAGVIFYGAFAWIFKFSAFRELLSVAGRRWSRQS